MTAFYMFRLLWLTFFGASRMSHEVEHHVHESPLSMTGVLAVLAALSAFGGFIPIPHFLEPMLPLPPTHESLHHLETPLKFLAMGIAVLGVLGAWFFFGNGAKRAASVAKSFASLHSVLANKYFIDELYERVIGKPLVWIADRVFLRFGDRQVIDATLNGLAALGQRSAGVLSRVQTGSLHLYAGFVLIGIVGALLWSWRHV